jgi:chromosome segregation ATPase
MLHEGVSLAARQQQNQQQDVHTFFAEVTLDNASRRIPVEADTLTIRKSYNTQTDREDYLLNGKTIREKELFNLFESGGFSFKAQSQFQVIKQGQVQEMVQRGEASFLDMLKEVTGTRLFDEKLQKMEQALADAEVKKQSL